MSNRREQGNSPRRWRARPEKWWWIAAVVLIPVVVVTAAAAVLLLLTTHPHQASDEIDLAKTALSVGAGTGGVAALILAFRRQWHSEESSRATESDAVERRITELYTKAVDQLGSDKAPVRLGGLYALERLAQSNTDQQDTIAAVICAYLRMPFVIRIPTDNDSTPPKMNISELTETNQEYQVRATAQAILARHLQPGLATPSGDSLYWPSVQLDLSGAVLIDLDFSGCHLRDAIFTGTDFSGQCRFVETQFLGVTDFSGAHIAYTNLSTANFTRAKFSTFTRFNKTRFTNRVTFAAAKFDGPVELESTYFGRETDFTGTEFLSAAIFTASDFAGPTTFESAKFHFSASFNEVDFLETVVFERAKFMKSAQFAEAAFRGDVSFAEATFGDMGFNQIHLEGGGLARLPNPWVQAGHHYGSFPHGWSIVQAQSKTATNAGWLEVAKVDGRNQQRVSLYSKVRNPSSEKANESGHPSTRYEQFPDGEPF